jgi:hypothetical protein
MLSVIDSHGPRRPKGIVRLYEGGEVRRGGSARCLRNSGWRRGKLLWERENLFVNAGLPSLASLMAGVTSGEYALAVGFGSGNTTPALTDTDVTAPKYYNAVAGHTLSGPAVTFNFALTLNVDYGASGITIQELGLYANTGAAVLPAASGTSNPSWAATTAKTVGNLIVDSNGNIQRCTTAGNTGTSAPTWATTIGATTNDSTGGGTAVWTLVALHTAPTPLMAHVLQPSFLFNNTGTFTGTWTFTF